MALISWDTGDESRPGNRGCLGLSFMKWIPNLCDYNAFFGFASLNNPPACATSFRSADGFQRSP